MIQGAWTVVKLESPVWKEKSLQVVNLQAFGTAYRPPPL